MPIEKVSIVLNSDNIKFKNKACYQGKLDSNKPCKITTKNIFENNGKLNPYEGLSIAASFSKDSVEKVELWDFSKTGWLAIIFSFIASVLGGVVVFVRKYLNKFKPNTPIIPIYRPYKNYHPALTGFLIDKKFDPQDITAGILSLAQKGIIEIERVEEKGVSFLVKPDYIFRLKKDLEEIDDELDKMFMVLLFSKPFNLDDILSFLNEAKKIIINKKLHNEDENIIFKLYKKSQYLKNKLYIKNYNKLEKEIKLSNLKLKNYELYLRKQNIENWIEDYFIKNNFIQKFFNNIRNKKLEWIITPIFILLVLFSNIITRYEIWFFCLFILIFLFILFLIFVKLRYTKKGWEIKNNLEGFKLFLEMTEKKKG